MQHILVCPSEDGKLVPAESTTAKRSHEQFRDRINYGNRKVQLVLASPQGETQIPN